MKKNAFISACLVMAILTFGVNRGWAANPDISRTPHTTDCALASGQMELCEQEPYKSTCVLLRAVSRALCEAELPPGVGVLAFIPSEAPYLVVILGSYAN